MPTQDPLPSWLIEQRLEVGGRIRTARMRADLTQEKLAELVGVERRTIVRTELGITSPPLDRILAIARALNVPPAGLMPNGPGHPHGGGG